MNKKLINNLDEYRKWAFGISASSSSCHLDDSLGLNISYDCWDYNDKGEEIDEDGNVVPDTTAENVKLEKWVEELEFPVVAVYVFEKSFDRTGDLEIVLCEFVSIKDFQINNN